MNLAVPLLNQVLLLSDGRRIGVAECGDPGGEVVLDFYPLGGSRLIIALSKPCQGVRLMCIDRPGSGLSSPGSQHASPTQFADDILQVLELKKIERVHIVASCCGAIYGLAFIAKYPSRVLSAHLLAPWVSPDLSSAALRFVKYYVPKPLVDITSRFSNTLLLSSFNSMTLSTMLPEERATYDHEMLPVCKAIWEENSRLSSEGNKLDMSVCVEKVQWGFSYSDVRYPLTIIAGTKDTVVLPPSAEAIAAALPDAKLEWVPASHTGVLMLQKDVVLRKIAATPSPAT